MLYGVSQKAVFTDVLRPLQTPSAASRRIAERKQRLVSEGSVISYGEITNSCFEQGVVIEAMLVQCM